MSKDESRPIYLRAKVLNRGTKVPFVVNVFSSVKPLIRAHLDDTKLSVLLAVLFFVVFVKKPATFSLLVAGLVLSGDRILCLRLR